MEKPEIIVLGMHIKVKDFDKSRQFYESLGFKPFFAFGDEAFRATLPKGLPSASENYRGMSFMVGEIAELEIAEDHIGVPDKSIFKDKIKTAKVSGIVRVKSVVPLFTNPLVKIKFPVRNYYWGSIEVAFRDPDGYVLVFTAPYSDEEYKKVSEFTTIETINPGD